MEFRGLFLLLLGLLLGDSFGFQDGNHSLQVCNSECPTWFNQVSNNGTISFVCGNPLVERVVCDQNSNSSILQYQYCMTYSEVNKSTVSISCPYASHMPDVEGLYVQLPESVCDLNDFVCGGLNRTGLLCSHCEAGLGPAVFSYTLPCMKCLDSGYGWLLYMFLATFPNTVMFLVVIFCQIRITSAPMNAFIFACQTITATINSSPHSYTDVSKPGDHLTSLFLIAYGVWNLDFFRYIIPPFCISSTMTSIQALSLEYIVAFYPLFLIVTLYTGIQLHASGCRVLVYLWRPFQRCCACIARRWNPLHSLVHAFAAFLLLSYSKILFVSFSLLHYGRIQDSHGNNVGPFIMYYNASVPYFGSDHLPFALLAIFILATFSVLPVLILLLYPTRVFQRCIGCCSTRWHGLHIFVDAFQGYYKDGTNGTPDWRYFSGLYLIFRIMAIATHVLPDTHYGMLYRITGSSFVALLFGLLRPYKESWVNYWDSIGFALLALSELVVVYAKYVLRTRFGFIYGLAVVPLVYLIVYATYKLLSRTRLRHHCALFCNNQSGEGDSATSVGDVEREACTGSEEDEPLLIPVGDTAGEGDREV